MNRVIMVGLLLKETARGWNEHRVFYTTLALAPLTLIAIAIAGYFLGPEAARGGIVKQIEHLVGRTEARAIEGLIQAASEPRQSRILLPHEGASSLLERGAWTPERRTSFVELPS